MILSSLARLAEREGLVEDPSYVQQPVQWILVVSTGGRFVAFQSLLQPTSSGRPGRVGLTIAVPRPAPGARRSGIAPDPRFLVENASFLLGIDLTKKQKLASRPGELERRFSGFLDLVREATDATGDPAVAAVARLLAHEEEMSKAREQARSRAADGELLSNHLITFKFEGEWVHLREPVRKHWSSSRAEVAAQEEIAQCLATGQVVAIADKHPPIKRVPGGTASGIALVSFNSSAFESYGFERNENAPVGRAAAEAYTTALNRLLTDWPDPRDPNQQLPRQRVQLSKDTVAVFWTDGDSRVPAALAPAIENGDSEAAAALGVRLGTGFEDLIVREAGDAREIREVHQAPWRGLRPQDLTDLSPFRLLVLSGGQGRATVRAFHSSNVAATVRAVQQWFGDLALGSLRGPLPLWRLLKTLAVHGDARKRLPPNLGGELFLVAVSGRALPRGLLEAAVRRARSEPAKPVPPERAALIKVWLNRALRDPAESARLTNENIHFQELMTTMNEGECNRGYLLGRLFACVERMQELALGEVGASVTDRYFAAACATPQAAFPRLLKMEIHHYRKARDGGRASTARWLHRQIDDIAAALVSASNGLREGESIEGFMRRSVGRPLVGFPSFLPLPEQGLFTLGYHQQRAALFTKRPSAEVPDEKACDAPEASQSS